jgi:parallel beta-helix repeat protein
MGLALVFSLAGCSGSISGGKDGSDDGADDGTNDGTNDGDGDELPRCGNNRIDPGETCDPPNTCPADCDDLDPCTTDHRTGSVSTCDVVCTHEETIDTCANGDGCCPTGCTLNTDTDCPYYVDATGGDDAHDGLTPETAWKTAAHASQQTLKPGDRIAFKRGEVWHETFHVGWSGSQQAPIVIASYGGGTEPPIFSPTQVVTSWNAEANQRFSASLSTTPKQVLVDGVRLHFARHPNQGYLYVAQKADPSSSFEKKAGDLTTQSAQDLIGSTVLLRGTPWQFYTNVVTGFSGQTITLAGPTRSLAIIYGNVGYLLINKLWMLDEPGEWFYDTAAQKLYVRLADDGNPASHRIEISLAAHGIDVVNAKHILLDGLGVRHAGLNGVEIQGSSDDIHVRNCRVENSVLYGIRVLNPAPATVVELDHNVIRNSNYSGITVYFPNPDPNARQAIVLRGNSVEETGTDFPVVGGSSYDWAFGAGIDLRGGGALMEENVVTSAGYSCSIIGGADLQILHNHMERCCLFFDDGGGIYVGGNGVNVLVRGNTVVDSLGNAEGTPRFFADRSTLGHGIYADDGSSTIQFIDNTIVNSDYGVQLHNTSNGVVHGNTFIGNRRYGLYASSGNRGNTVEENVFFSAGGAPAVYESYGNGQTVDQASYNNNRYWHAEGLRPLVRETNTATTRSINEYSLEEWRAETGFDASSTDFATNYQVFTIFGRPTGAANLITNGSFDANVNGWIAGPANVSVAWTSGCGLSGGCLSATRTGGSGGAFVGSNSFTIVKDRGYLLRFSVRAAARVSLEGIVRRTANPWDILGLSRRITVLSTRSDYVWPFIATDSATARFDSGRFDYLGGVDYAFFLDDVDLREADVVENDPADDARILLNPTSAESAVDLGAATYCDLAGNEVSGTVTVPAFGSKLLLSCTCNNDGACNNRETAASCSGDCP